MSQWLLNEDLYRAPEAPAIVDLTRSRGDEDSLRTLDRDFGDVDADVPLERAGGELGRPQVQEDGRVHEDRVARRLDRQLLDQDVLKLVERQQMKPSATLGPKNRAGICIFANF